MSSLRNFVTTTIVPHTQLICDEAKASRGDTVAPLLRDACLTMATIISTRLLGLVPCACAARTQRAAVHIHRTAMLVPHRLNRRFNSLSQDLLADNVLVVVQRLATRRQRRL